MRRGKVVCCVFLILLLLLAGRLYNIQILNGDELAMAAQGQQRIPILWDNSGTVIYDRNMIPLTGTTPAYYYLIPKADMTAATVRTLQRMEAEPAGQKGDAYLVYRTTCYSPNDTFVLQKQGKAYAFCVNAPYGSDMVAKALLLDLDQMTRQNTVEQKTALYFLGNAAGDVISGTGMMEEPKVKTACITTLDLSLQQKLESCFESMNLQGCGMITDTRNGQVLAMASRSENEAFPNLAIEQAVKLGGLYELVETVAKKTDMTSKETAAALGLGEPVFADYPGEDTGSIEGKKSKGTAAQVSRMLTVITNQGEKMPLTLMMTMVQEDDLAKIIMPEDAKESLRLYQMELAERPLISGGWAAGYVGTDGVYSMVLHIEGQSPKKLYLEIADELF